MASVAQVRTDYAQYNSRLRIGVIPLRETMNLPVFQSRLYLLMECRRVRVAHCVCQPCEPDAGARQHEAA
ncbi:MAG: hypothetical protein U0163_17500 [Gemmatimonadaceae bacterium]